MGVSACPSSLKLERIGTTNARVSWIPSNTEQFHMVTVEDLSDERYKFVFDFKSILRS